MTTPIRWHRCSRSRTKNVTIRFGQLESVLVAGLQSLHPDNNRYTGNST